MKSITRKSTLLALLLISSSTISFAASEAEMKAYKNSCVEGWAKSGHQPQSNELKQFGSNYCDCAAEEYLDKTEKNSKKLSSTDENQILSFCMNKSLLSKTASKLINSSNINSSLTEDTCKQIYSSLESQAGAAVNKIDPEIEKFCKCSSADLSNSLNNHLSDNELAKSVDKIAADCSDYN